LLPGHAQFDYFTFAATYVFACILGWQATPQAGLAFLKRDAESRPVSEEALIASLVLFRVIYYLVPFLFASLSLARMRVFAAGTACARPCAEARRNCLGG